MSEAFETDVQQPPGVSPLAVAGPVVLIFVIAAAVMAILVGAFWIKLGILPTEMAGVVRNSFPAPELQIDPLGDLQANRIRAEQQLKGEAGVGPTGGAPAVTAAEARPSAPNSKVPEPTVGVSAAPQLANAERASQQVGPKPAMSIKAAMARIASRPDPYAPLLPEGEVPDSAGQRAMSRPQHCAVRRYHGANAGRIEIERDRAGGGTKWGDGASGTGTGQRTFVDTRPGRTHNPSSFRKLPRHANLWRHE